jgi:hypothetical protein
MPDSVPGIALDDAGLCDLCRDYRPPDYRGEEELVRVFDAARAAGQKYDCIVPLSGGRDSTFVLYLAKSKYNLNVLPVNYDNDFRVDQAIVNMQTACDRLGVEFYEVQSRRSITKKIVRYEIKYNIPRGLFAVSEILCGACAYGYRAAVYRTALKFRVPLIIWGSSETESTPPVMNDSFRMIKSEVEQRYRRPIIFSLFNPAYLKLKLYKTLQRIEFHVPGNSIFSDGPLVLKDKSIKQISLFDYLPWNRDEIKKTITEKMGWRKPEDRVSSWRTDCMIPPFINYCLFNLFGMSKSCIGYCNMINDHQMGREEALAQEETVTGEFTESLYKLLEDEIGLSRKDVERIKSYQSKSKKSRRKANNLSE